MNPLELPGADLAIAKTADVTTVVSGFNITYTTTVTNNGHDGASNVALLDAVPVGTTFQSLSAPSGWNCTTPAVGSGGQVSCATASMDNGATAQFVLVVNVPCATVDGTQIVSSAAVSSETRDPNPTPNNMATATVTVSNPAPFIHHLFASDHILFPPNRRLENVFLFYKVSDNCDAGLTPVVTVTSNEPVTAFGDRTSPDWVVVNPHWVKLRAENNRFERGPRIYTITVTVTDSAGTSTSDSARVFVFF